MEKVLMKCIFPHSKKESLKHLVIKAIVFHILFRKNRLVATELKNGKGIADVFDLENKIAYEIESNPTKFKKQRKFEILSEANDVFVINLREVPDEINKARKYLERIVV